MQCMQQWFKERKGSTEEPQNGMKLQTVWFQMKSEKILLQIPLRITTETKLSFQHKILTGTLLINIELSRWNIKEYDTWNL